MARGTEMGKQPERWDIKSIESFIKKIGDGGTPSRTDPNNFGGPIPWVTIDDIRPYIEKTIETLTKKGLSESNAKLWPAGSIILSTGATIGEVGIAVVPLTTKQGITGIILDDKQVFNKFFRYQLIHNKNLLLQFSQGTSFREIRPPTLIKLKFSLPPLSEQRKIASILETVDNAIEKTDRIIEKYKRMKQGLMQDLLTKGIDENWQIRSENTHRFKDSPLGRIPEEWEVKKLGEVFTIKAGGDVAKLNYSKDSDEKYKFPIYSNGIENKGLYGYADTYNFPENSITVSGRGTLGVAIPRFEKFNAIIRVLVLIPKCPIQIIYVAECINSNVNFEIESTGVPQLTAPKISQYSVPLPPLPEQKRIDSILLQIDNAIEKEQKYKEKLQRIKQGLMEDLLTGKVRVNNLIEESENEPTS